MQFSQPPPSHYPACAICDDRDDDECFCHVPSPTPIPCINPIARLLLAAVHKPSPNSPFNILSKCPDVLPIIYAHLRRIWLDSITPPPKRVTCRGNRRDLETDLSQHELSRVALCRIGKLYSPFPEPSGLNCNMMPFISTNLDTIPSEYHGYLKIIRHCRERVEVRDGDVWYLTIHESAIERGRPQRRSGVHVEGFLAAPAAGKQIPCWFGWGFGAQQPETCFSGGIFHASSVTGTCRMWNAQIPREPSDLLHSGCDLEQIRDVLGEVVKPVLLAQDEIYWFTDATPHESLPCEESYRQYFRLVVGKIGAWWEKHSTPNPLGVQPACRVLKHDKFEKDAYVGFDMDGPAGAGGTEAS